MSILFTKITGPLIYKSISKDVTVVIDKSERIVGAICIHTMCYTEMGREPEVGQVFNNDVRIIKAVNTVFLVKEYGGTTVYLYFDTFEGAKAYFEGN